MNNNSIYQIYAYNLVVMGGVVVQNDLYIYIISMYYWLDGSAINEHKEQNKNKNKTLSYE